MSNPRPTTVADKKKIYLASRSPRRRELLKQIGVNFEVLLMRNFPAVRADLDEAPLKGEKPEDYVVRMARAKAETGWTRLLERALPRSPVLGADTTVALGEEIFGKPANHAEAEAMLRKLAGKQHQVLSAVAMASEGTIDAVLSRSTVTFGAMDDALIRAYVLAGESLDKAGGYGIQGRAACFISHIEGSYSGIMGLPLFETVQLLRRYGIVVL